MLLRRVIQHVKDQHWTAIGIDFVIVVIGVFVGIQVSNWNEERGTRRKAEDFTARLESDLRDESWRYQFLLEYYRDVRSAAEKAADALNGKAPLANEEFLVNAYRATQYKQGAARRSTYDELVSTGNIGLIQDLNLRHLAVRTYSIATIDTLVKEGVESRYRELFRMNTPTDVQRTLSKQCGDRYILPGDYREFDKVIDYSCTTGLPEGVIDAAAESLRSDPQTLRLLRLRISDLDTRLFDLVENNKDVYEFLLGMSRKTP